MYGSKKNKNGQGSITLVDLNEERTKEEKKGKPSKPPSTLRVSRIKYPGTLKPFCCFLSNGNQGTQERAVKVNSRVLLLLFFCVAFCYEKQNTGFLKINKGVFYGLGVLVSSRTKERMG